jgi:quercetin dioxygenase-like cupin family protein
MRPGIALLALAIWLVAARGDEHAMKGFQLHLAKETKWQDAPPSVPKGAQIAVLEGDLSKEGPFVVRFKLPDGYRVPAHTHPKTERVTVISGTLNIGMGDKFDEKATTPMPAGTFGAWEAGMKHFAWAKGETIIQLHGMGPWSITYVDAKDDPRADAWRALPLVREGKVDPAWVQIGYGGFAVEDGSLRTQCDERGLGLLLYRPEQFGDCHIRVVYKSKDARSNAGVFVRIDDGVLEKVKEKHAPARRDARGRLTADSLQIFKGASDKEQGPWYAVHHGYEVQICDAADGKRSRTGAVYSLAESAALSAKPPTEWKTMVITLDGNRILVDIDGQRVTTFDPDGKAVPADRQWFEPRRQPKRPTAGYLGLQNHDPGDVVYFKEVSVRPLMKAK